jgi:hypothetical protein
MDINGDFHIPLHMKPVEHNIVEILRNTVIALKISQIGASCSCNKKCHVITSKTDMLSHPLFCLIFEAVPKSPSPTPISRRAKNDFYLIANF